MLVVTELESAKMALQSPPFRKSDAVYAPPKLTRYGDVAKLTATGSKSGNENLGNTQGMN